ncbi:MAG: c-type cytochrome [Flavobacteriales bacterium]|nr:c-type cytochrome [Flavobacteriales bacterium]
MKPYKIFALLFLGIPTVGFANNSIAKASGISDAILTAVLVGVIVLLLVIAKVLANSIEAIGKPKQEEKDHSTSKKIISLCLLGALSFTAQAAENSTPTTPIFILSNQLFWTLISLILLLAIVIGILFKSLNTLIRIQRGESFEEATERVDLFKSLNLTDNTPIEMEVDIMLDHDYDGIRELDNNLPPWWKYMFYATIVFSFIYVFRYHISGDGQLQIAEYLTEIEAATAKKESMMANATESITEDNVVYLIDAATIEKGAAIFKGNCATCHGQLGEGGAGPNLTDEYWVHGGGIKNVFKSIKYGIPAKGMIAWQSQFNPSQLQKVASYVLSLQGTNPPNAKSPQGPKYIEEEKAEVEQELVATDSTEVASEQ